MHSAFIYTQAFGKFKAYEGYPWLFARSDVTYELCKKLRLLDRDWMHVYTPKPASDEEILTFHTKKYLTILKKANKGLFQEKWLRYGLGTIECPVYKGVFDYHALAAGSTLLGAELIDKGKADIVFSPTGGFHHAGREFAAGFCYINDIVLAIRRWLDRRKRVLYIDVDAHHSDQVQEAFYSTSRVMCISFHESPKTLFPFKTGFESEIGRGRGKGYNINVPLPQHTSDEEFLWAYEKIMGPVAQAFKPDVVVAVLGADVLFSDPFSHLRLTNASITKALETILAVSPRLLALGCGGYVLDNIARTWALAWAFMNGLQPREDDAALFGGMFWGDSISSLNDRPHFIPDEVRQKVRMDLERVVRAIETDVFPILEIES